MAQGYTKEQLLKMGAKPAGFTLDQLKAKQTFPTGAPPEIKKSFFDKLFSFGQGAQDFAVGIAKGATNTVVSSQDLVSKGLDKIASPVVKAITGKEDQFAGSGSLKTVVPEAAYTPKNATEKAGFVTEQIGEFFIPAGAGAKVAKVAEGAQLVTKLPKIAQGATKLLARSGTEAATMATVSAAQGGTAEEVRDAGIIGAIFPIVGKALGMTGKQIFEKLPKRIMQNVIGQTKAAKLSGQDVSEYALKKRKVGTVDKLISDSSEAVTKLNSEVQHLLENVAPKTARILKNEILSKVTTKINSEGGEITAKEVSGILETLAPQIKSLLKKQSLSLPEANRLRQALDKTLGDRGFLTSQLPYNKTILKSFDDVLREKVKSLAPKGTRDLFKELSSEITLRNALMSKYASKSGTQMLNAFEYILAGIGGVGAGLPGAIGALAVKKVTQSPLAKTITAQILDKSGKVIRKNKGIAPLLKGGAIKANQERD